jgi:hypothetical protein
VRSRLWALWASAQEKWEVAMKRLLCAWVALGVALTATGWCRGAVMNVRLYRLGENDVPPAVPGAPGDDPTRDIISGANAHKIGLTFYTGATPVFPDLSCSC